jgi:hypothetical protein
MQIVQQAQQHVQQLEAGAAGGARAASRKRASKPSRPSASRMINANSRQDVEELKGWISMLMQSMTPPPGLELAAMATQDQQEEQEQIAQGLGQPPESAPGQY